MSLKAAMGMWCCGTRPIPIVCWTPLKTRTKREKGYYEGLYENGDGPINEFTANNNGIMLEALLFKRRKTAAVFQRQSENRDFAPSLWDKKLVDLFEPNNGPRNRPFLSNTPPSKHGASRPGPPSAPNPPARPASVPPARLMSPLNFRR